jgi:hypothetical protein
MGRIRSPETSVQNQPTLRNNPEDDRILVNRSGSLQSRKSNLLADALYICYINKK